jgi:hypothetical protein
MSKSKHTEAQIIAALKQVAGRKAEDVAGECDIPTDHFPARVTKTASRVAYSDRLV